MSDGHDYSMILFIFMFLSYLLPICCSGTQPKTTAGFKTSFENIKDCSNPSKPYVKHPPLVFHTFVSFNKALSGNVTLSKDLKNLKIRVRGYILRDGKWEFFYLLNNLDCHGMVLHLICVAMNIKYDRKTCIFPKGSYTFENVDVNQMLHFWVSNVKYGHIMWRSETYIPAGTFTCKEFYTLIEPA